MASEHVGVGGHHDDPAGVGPVAAQAFPDAARALGDVGLAGTLVIHRACAGQHWKTLAGALSPVAAGRDLDDLFGCNRFSPLTRLRFQAAGAIPCSPVPVIGSQLVVG